MTPTAPSMDYEDEQPSSPNICSICHSEPPVNAVKIDCSHIFCHLCIKSVKETTGLCPLCRTEIGIEFDFVEHEILGLAKVPSSTSGNFWFYEGFRGWWLYDAETNREIEDAYLRGATHLEKWIAGSIYTINITQLTQQRKDGEGRIRKICRSTLDLPNIIGMAGIRGEDFKEMLDMMRSAEAQGMSRQVG